MKTKAKTLKTKTSETHLKIIKASAELFAKNGYHSTSVRDIAKHVGMHGGSLYYHIESKEKLFIKIHDVALEAAEDRILSAIKNHLTPWQKLETACIELLYIQLDPKSITMPIMSDFTTVPKNVQNILIIRRNKFEQIFTNLISDIALTKEIDKDIYRILLLSLLNNVNTWYKTGRMSIEEIGNQIMLIFRHQIEK